MGQLEFLLKLSQKLENLKVSHFSLARNNCGCIGLIPHPILYLWHAHAAKNKIK